MWAYSRDYDVVRVVLTASETPDAFARQSVTESMSALVGLGAMLVDRSDTANVTTVTLRRQGHVMAFPGVSFRDAERGFALVVTVVHANREYARAVADSLYVPVEERAAGLASAGLPRDEIDAAIRASMQSIRACYWTRLGARPELRGRVVASFSVRADGTVQDSIIRESTMDDDVVDQCVARAITNLRFDARAPGSALVRVDHPFELERAPRGPATFAPRTPADGEPRGSLSRASIQRVIRESIGEVRACYEMILGTQPDLRGRVTVSFIISAEGAVTSAVVSSSTLNHPGVEDCVAHVVGTLQFPRPTAEAWSE